MKSLQRVIVWNPILYLSIVLLISSFIISYLIEKKQSNLSLETLEYIRDQKYKFLNKDNLREAFDFTSLNYTTYIIDEKGVTLFDIPYKVEPGIVKLCSENTSPKSAIIKNHAGAEKSYAIKKNGNLCFVVEGNTNNSIVISSFAQKIFYGQILILILISYLLLRLGYKRTIQPIKIVIENNENALVSKWESIKGVTSKIDELNNLDKYSSYVIEMLKQSRGLGASEKALEIKEIQTKYISNRAKYETEKFKLAVDASPNFTYIVDLHGYILYINKEVTKSLGYVFQESENKRAIDLWHKDDTPESWKTYFDDAQKNRKSVRFNSFGYKKNGVKYEGDIIITPIENEQNNVENFLVVERDVTEEKQKERLKSEFISVVSHELRTPMSVIRGYSSLLAEGTLGQLNEKQKEYVDRINSETGRLLELANDMLDIQKFESGKIELKFTKLNLLPVIEKVVNAYLDPFAKKGLPLIIENNTQSENLLNAMIDQKYFERALSNLLSNAMKYTMKGEVRVFLLNPDPDHIVIAVKDTGLGIPESSIPHLFQRFYQAEGVMARKQEGSGLGLSIVKTVTEAHHGMCWVESKVDVGSTFYIALPVEK